jgi:hypothetical protein
MSDDPRDFIRNKLATIDRIRHDGRLSASTRMIGAEIFSLIDFSTGDAWPSGQYLAEKLSRGYRTVKMAVAALKAAGYIEVVKRGRCNRYRPVFEARQQGQNLPLSEAEQGQNLPLSDADRGKKRPEQGQKPPPNRGKKGPPISLETSLGLLRGGASGPVGAPDGAAGPPAFDLGIPGVMLRRRLGDDVFASWLGKVAFVSAEGAELVLAAPSKFVADYLKAQFEAAIIEAWRVEHAELQRLRVTVAPAPVTALSSRRQSEQADARWLVDVGRDIVRERLCVSMDAANVTVVEWLKRCGRDVAGLRRIIAEAADQDLSGEQFRNVVKQRTKALLFADQPVLKFGPEAALKRSAS